MDTPEEQETDAEFDKAFDEAASLGDANGTEAPAESFEDDEPAQAQQNDDDDGANVLSEAEQQIADLQAKLAASEHAIQSEKGRVKALQGKLNSQKEPAQQHSSGEPNGEGDDDESNEDDFGSDYPEVDELINRRLNSRLQPIEERVRQEAEAAALEEQQNSVSEFYKAVASQHSDFNDIRVSDDFKNWYSEQPPEVQTMANSWDPRNGVAVINMYKATNPGARRKADNNNLLDDMEDLPQKGGPRVSNTADDFDRAFEKAAKQYG